MQYLIKVNGLTVKNYLCNTFLCSLVPFPKILQTIALYILQLHVIRDTNVILYKFLFVNLLF